MLRDYVLGEANASRVPRYIFDTAFLRTCGERGATPCSREFAEAVPAWARSARAGARFKFSLLQVYAGARVGTEVGRGDAAATTRTVRGPSWLRLALVCPADDPRCGVNATQPTISGLPVDLVTAQAGPAESGAPFHYHRPAFNALFYGRKRWAALPPQDAVYGVTPASRLFDGASFPFSRKPRQCVQDAGDVVVLPGLWAHATLNRAFSVGVAGEFSLALRAPSSADTACVGDLAGEGGCEALPPASGVFERPAPRRGRGAPAHL